MPNLFIVGAGKAGTFSIYQHLGKHSEIYMAPVKEPNFFGKDLHFRFPRCSEQEYLDLFHGTQDYKYRGEASVYYLLSQSAAKEIKIFSPKAKIIILLRNPVDMMYARYSQNRKYAHENIESFEEALIKENLRREGKCIPNETLVIESLFYREWVRYTEQVRRYLTYFGWENVFVGTFDDLVMAPDKFLCQLGSFLELEGLDRIPLERVNPNIVVRSDLVNLIARGKIEFINPFVKLVLPLRGIRKVVRNYVIKLNQKITERELLNPALLEELRSELRHEVEELSSLLGRNLTHWISRE